MQVLSRVGHLSESSKQSLAIARVLKKLLCASIDAIDRIAGALPMMRDARDQPGHNTSATARLRRVQQWECALSKELQNTNSGALLIKV